MNIRVGGSDGDIFIWQAQLETGSVATSPIVTTAGTASRVADVVSLTGASSLIGQAEGSIFMELENRAEATVRSMLTLSDGTTTNRIRLRKTGSTTYELERNKSAVASITSTISTAPASGLVKIAIGYSADSGGFLMYINTIEGSTATGGMFSGEISQINLGSLESGAGVMNGWLRAVALFPTRLANATLAVLTQ
jgi:hypothetical protein